MKTQLSKGFTLIELLVVIGILGILAGTLFFTINPVEQLNRGRDSARKSAIQTFTTAASAYNATRGYYPWTASPAVANCNPTVGTATAFNNATLVAGCVTELINTGELRDTFNDDASVMASLLLTEINANNYAVCFDPQSTSESTAATFGSTGGSGTTHWCVLQ